MPAALGRLRMRADFLRVAAASRKCAKPGLILQVARRPPGARSGPPGREGQPRVGFTASRKVGTAVERNRARRRLRAAVREIMAAHARPGHDYVVVARRETLTRPFKYLLADLESALRKLGAYQDDGHANARA